VIGEWVTVAATEAWLILNFRMPINSMFVGCHVALLQASGKNGRVFPQADIEGNKVNLP
jgi:hypothetical protein